ncbi:MAG: phospholipase [Proteobacteria bacterium]|nr:phospholipase [Pseudomonadota bacterium]
MWNSKFYEYSITQNPKYLVIFLHGYGSNGENLIGLSGEFQRTLPDAHYISPNAIEPWEGGFPDAYQWFSLYHGNDRKALHQISDNIKNSNKALTSFIEAQLERFSLKPENLFIAGFSQGAMMAIYQGMVMREKPAGIISFSGRVVLPEAVGETIRTKPEICLIHGQKDSVLPFECFIEAKKILTEKDISHEAHSFQELDHTIDIQGIRVALNFIKKQIT